MSLEMSTSQPNGDLDYGTDPISDEMLVYFELFFRFCLNPCLSILAIFANIINIVVFAKMDLSDGVTQNFFILSISDGLFACCASILNSSFIAFSFLKNQIINPIFSADLAESVFVMSYYVIACPLGVSMITTVVIAIVRCCCVAMPLKVKDILTPKRQLVAILIPSAIYIGVITYALLSVKFYNIFDPQSNSTYLVLKGGGNQIIALSQNLVPFLSYIIVVVCVVIIAAALRRSSSFRASSTSGQASSTAGSFELNVTSRTKQKERLREMRVVKTVTLLCCSFIVSSTSFVVLTVLYATLPGFQYNGKYHNSNLLCLMVSDSMILLNVVVNICIYYIYNTSYRVTLRSIFKRCAC